MTYWMNRGGPAVLVALCALLAGCGTAEYRVADDLAPAAIAPVAVLPFESLGSEPNAGLILSELLATRLAAGKAVTTLPPERVRQALAPLEGAVLDPLALGKTLGARTLLVGSVTEYRYKRGIAQEPAIGLVLRLVRAEDGEILWSASLHRTGRHSWIGEDSLSRLAQAMCREAAGRLEKELGHD